MPTEEHLIEVEDEVIELAEELPTHGEVVNSYMQRIRRAFFRRVLPEPLFTLIDKWMQSK